MKNHTMMIICNKDVKTERSTHRCLTKRKEEENLPLNFYVGWHSYISITHI